MIRGGPPDLRLAAMALLSGLDSAEIAALRWGRIDPAATESVLQLLIQHVAGERTTVFFSSHQIAEIDQIADRVVIIGRGRAVVSGALDDLRASFRSIQLVFDREAPAPPGLAGKLSMGIGGINACVVSRPWS